VCVLGAFCTKKYSPVHRRVLEGVLEEFKERFFGPSTPWNFFFGIFLYWVVCTVEFKEQPNQGRGRGRGRGRDYGGRNNCGRGRSNAHGNAVQAQTNEEVGWAFRVSGATHLPSSDDDASGSDQSSESTSTQESLPSLIPPELSSAWPGPTDPVLHTADLSYITNIVNTYCAYHL